MTQTNRVTHPTYLSSDMVVGCTIGVQKHGSWHTFICVPWLICKRHATHLNVPAQRCGSVSYYRRAEEWVMSRIHVCHVTHSCVWYESYERGLPHVLIWLWRGRGAYYRRAEQWDMSRIHVCDVTHMSEACHTCKYTWAVTWQGGVL